VGAARPGLGELASVAFLAPTIALRSDGGDVTHRAPNGGIDVHHIFFEGLSPEGDVWRISWGS
jgi:hypothetical protein